MASTETYTTQNRRAWDEIADVRHRKQKTADYFAGGGCDLPESVLVAAGDVRGMRLCHLQCATGEDTLSWANRGADVTGVDISPKQVALARQKALSAGIAARFVSADVYDLPPELHAEKFDLVFTGGGSIVWLPDLWRWARTVAELLSPQGRLILEEEHPLADCLTVRDGHIVIASDYFRRHPVTYTGWTHFAGGESASEEKHNFAWPLGDVVTSIARAGLRIDLLQETPSQNHWRFGEQLSEVVRLPGDYLLVAVKDPAT